MFIDKDELKRRVSSEHNVAERLKVVEAVAFDDNNPIARLDTSKFNKAGTAREKAQMSPDLRAVVAGAAMLAGPEVAAEIGNISTGYASVLARGEYSTHADPEERQRRNDELREAIYRGLGEIRERAQAKLLQVLDQINTGTLDAIADKDKARLAAQMANQLSGVIDRTIQKGEGLVDQRSAHLHLYAPEQRPLASFDIKKVNATAIE